ncbi:hypothetical protein Tco_0378263 [Tanacetum coccineum]
MESQSTQTIKIPILQPGEYDLWKMRMEQYLQCIDYTLWEIIENGNAPIVTKLVDGKETAIPPTSVEEKAQRRAYFSRRGHKVESSRTDLSRLRPDAVVNSLTPSLERSRRHRFMLAMPSPHSVSMILQEIWCRSVVLSVSSPNEPKSRVFPPNASKC